MTLVYTIKFRVSRSNYERLKEESKASGFRFVSEYIRDKAIGHAKMLENKVKENNMILWEIAKHMGIGEQVVKKVVEDKKVRRRQYSNGGVSEVSYQ